MTDMKDRAREYLRSQTQLNGGGLFHCNILNLILGFAEQETKELQEKIEKMKNWCNCKNYQQCLIELAEQGKGMNPSECCRNCKKWEIKDEQKETN
jgi:hypothetical protein